MAFFVKRNNANSFLSSTLGIGVTTLNVVTGAEFPSTFPFILTLWDASAYSSAGADPNMEIVLCINRVADALTIVRAQEGTADVEHAAGQKVAMFMTAGMFNDTIYGLEDGDNLASAINSSTTLIDDDNIAATILRNTDLINGGSF